MRIRADRVAPDEAEKMTLAALRKQFEEQKQALGRLVEKLREYGVLAAVLPTTDGRAEAAAAPPC